MSDFGDLIEKRDLSVFKITSESTEGDRVSLLSVQGAVRDHFGTYKYVEVGSHLGGMLVPHLCDPLCTHIVSIDKRPTSQYDARGRTFEYAGNSTDRMIQFIQRAIPEINLGKLSTIDADASEVPEHFIQYKADLFLIDAEHTNIAAASDFLSLLKFSHDNSVFLFHDANLIFESIIIVERILDYMGKYYSTLFLADNVAVILLGLSTSIITKLQERALNRTEYLMTSREYVNAQICANALIK